MASSPDEPNVRFRAEAQTFLDSQDITTQAEVIALASWLYGEPYIDGERKTMQRFPSANPSVSIYYRVYQDEGYTIVYDFHEDAQPPELVVLDIFLTSDF